LFRQKQLAVLARLLSIDPLALQLNQLVLQQGQPTFQKWVVALG
jgi:hypothetical protein